MPPIKKYGYGEQVIVNGQNVGTAKYDSETGQLLTPPTNPVAPTATTLSYTETPSEKALREARDSATRYYQAQSNQVIDEDQIRRDTLAQFQGEIDATNSIYADKLRRAQVQGIGRLGTSSAVNARRGLAGSDFGNAQTNQVEDANTEINNSLEEEKRVVVGALLTKARESGANAIAEKRAAKEKSIEEYLKNITSAGESAKVRASELAKTILLSKLGIEQYDQKALEDAATSAGVSVDAIRAAYADLKKQQDEADAIVKQKEFDNQLKTDTLNKPVNLGEGDAIVDPRTGKVIVQRAKTYAPKNGSGTSTSLTLSGYPQDIQEAAQSILDGKSKLNEYPSAKRLSINSAMSKIYTAEGGNELAQGAYDAITTLETMSGFTGAVGAKGVSSFFGIKGEPFAGTAAAGFKSELDKLKANLKLVNIKYLKGTGALSDAEGKTLEDAGTSLNPSLPETQFKTELARVKKVLLKANKVSQTPQNVIQAPDGQQIELID